MSIEPNARRRLRLVAATTRDPELMKDLRQVLEEDQMSFVPSANLLRDIATCAACTQDAPRTGRAGLCNEHRHRWNLECCVTGDPTVTPDRATLHELVQDLLASDEAGAQLLSAFERQRRALRMVWEAHARGAVRLPDSVAVTVEKACAAAPRFLPGVSRAVQQAS
jgi:hypothetical protein